MPDDDVIAAGGIEIPPMDPEADYVGGTMSDALLGAVIEYRYTRGTEYRLTFDDRFQLRFEELSAVRHPPTPTLPYRARAIREGQLLVHWIVKPASIHVSLVIDLEESKVHVAAMMPPNRWEFFDTAELTRVQLR